MTFGEYVRKRRIMLGFTLRKFSQKNNYDPAYVSRIENKLTLPPDNEEKLIALAQALEINKHTSDWDTFFDLAAIGKNKIPNDLVKENPQIVDFLPAFFRVARKKDIKNNDIETLLRIIRGDTSDDI